MMTDCHACHKRIKAASGMVTFATMHKKPVGYPQTIHISSHTRCVNACVSILMLSSMEFQECMRRPSKLEWDEWKAQWRSWLEL